VLLLSTFKKEKVNMIDSLVQIETLYYPRNTKIITDQMSQDELEKWPTNNFFDDDDFPIFCGEFGNNITSYIEIVQQALSYSECRELSLKDGYIGWYSKDEFEKRSFMLCQVIQPFIAISMGDFIGSGYDVEYSGGAEWDIREGIGQNEFLMDYASFFWGELKDEFSTHPSLKSRTLFKTFISLDEYSKPLYQSFIYSLEFSGGVDYSGEYDCETVIGERIDLNKINLAAIKKEKVK